MKKVKVKDEIEIMNKKNLEEVNLEELLPNLAACCCGVNTEKPMK